MDGKGKIKPNSSSDERGASEGLLVDGAVSVAVQQGFDYVPRKSPRWSGLSFFPAGQSKSLIWKKRLRKILDSTACQVSMMILLVYVLFVNNIIVLAEAPDEAIDPINVTMIVSVVLFGLELIGNAWAHPMKDWLYLMLEIIGTLSIFLEVTWVSDKLLPDNELKTENVSRTAIITSRAGRVTRLVRLIRFIRALKIFMMIRRYFARKVDSDQRQESLAPSNMGNTLADRISILVAFLVMVTMMMVMIFQTSQMDRSPQAFLTTLELYMNDTREALNPLVDDLQQFIDDGDANMRLKILQVGEHLWDFTPITGGLTGRENDRLEITGGRDDIKMVVDVSRQNKQEALFDMLLGLVVIVELCIFVALLHKNTSRILVAPLERIFNTIQTNASQIVNALEPTTEDTEVSEIDTIEAAINKMSKLVAHVTSSGTQGSHVVKDYMDNEHATEDTKAWLNDFLTQGSKTDKPTAFEKGKRSSWIKPGLEKVKTMERAKSVSVEASQEVSAQVQHMAKIDMDSLNSWDWDATQKTTEELMAAICLMFEDLELAAFEADVDLEDDTVEQPMVIQEVLWAFIDKVRQYYKDVPYHNFFHCVDVSHTTYRFINLTIQKTHMSREERFALMVAALCHDMDHPGLNNAFLVNSKHELARVYNDNSVLENRHVSCLYTLVAEHPEADIFKLLDPGTWKEVRKIIIQAILHTDMVHHFAMVSKVEVFYELHSSKINSEDPGNLFQNVDDRIFLMAMLLHCADISNPIKPLSICGKWADNVLNEFFRQGDLEKENGLPVSPMCNRDTTSKPMSQINFIEFIVAPLYFQVVRIFPELTMAMLHLRDNRRYWDESQLREIGSNSKLNPSEINEEKHKAQQRLNAFLQKYKEVFDKDRGVTSAGRATPEGL